MKFNFEEHVDPFDSAYSRHFDHGFIVWRRGTGGNAELLHLRVYDEHRGTGAGLSLLREMLQALKADPPYATVFGFTRAGNAEAREFYRKAGFTLSPVQGVYAEGQAVVFSAPYDELCKRHLGE